MTHSLRGEGRVRGIFSKEDDINSDHYFSGGFPVRIVIIICLFLFINILPLMAVPDQQPDPVLKTGEMRMDFNLEVNLIANSPASGWSASNSGLAKVFNQNPGQSEKMILTHGEYFFTDLWLQPLKGLKIDYGFEITESYADSDYQSVNIEHWMQNNYFGDSDKSSWKRFEDRFSFWKGKIEYDTSALQLRYASGFGHSSWATEGESIWLLS